MVTIRDQRFGVEIEVTGTTRHNIATAVAQAVSGQITATHLTAYDSTVVTDLQGREWQIKNDRSIEIVNGHGGSEVVTPVLRYEDIPLLQEVVRKVKACGAIAHRSCAVHIHISAEQHTPQSLTNLAKMYYKNEDLIFDALQVYPERRQRYCRPMDDEFIRKIVRRRPRTDRQLNEAWFGHYTPNPEHHHVSRYYVSPNIMCPHNQLV